MLGEINKRERKPSEGTKMEGLERNGKGKQGKERKGIVKEMKRKGRTR